jgi:hypothetical protein
MPALPMLEQKAVVEPVAAGPSAEELAKQAEAAAARLKEQEAEHKRQEEEKRAQEEAQRQQQEFAQAQAEAQKRAQEAEALALRLKQEEEARRKDAERLAAETAQRIAREREEEQSRLKLPVQIQESGLMLLRALDYHLAGSLRVAEFLRKRSGQHGQDLLARIECLIYASALENMQDKSYCEGALAGLSSKEAEAVNIDITRLLALSLQDVRCVKVSLSDGSFLYLDGSMHTVWSTTYVPCDFASPLNYVLGYINKYFYEDLPFILFNAPGYDVPSKEFVNFLSCLDGKTNRVSGLVLCGNKFEELQTISLSQSKKHNFIFGLWPWQFTEQRKVNALGEFKPWRFEAQDRELYLADIEMQIFGPQENHPLLLRGCALKGSMTDKIRVVILSNFSGTQITGQDIANTYLSHWPNIDEAFQDYSRKIELFTYTVNSQRFFNPEDAGFSAESALSTQEIFSRYLDALDLYFRWHILPQGYEDQGFKLLKERFYSLQVQTIKIKNFMQIKLLPPAGYAYIKDLEYACNRMNEREILSPEGLRLWFSAG